MTKTWWPSLSRRPDGTRKPLTFKPELTQLEARLTPASPNSAGYVATPFTFENHDIAGLPGTIDIVPPDPTAFPPPYDDFVTTLDFSTVATFRYYGVNYTDVNVCSNGFVSFNTANVHGDFSNENLATTGITDPMIAPLWDDLFQDASPLTMVLGRAEDTTGDGVADRLIFQWNQVGHFPNNGPVTFQLILQVNTGTTNGAITFNYFNLNFGNGAFDDGASATVGIKDNTSNNPGGNFQPGDALMTWFGIDGASQPLNTGDVSIRPTSGSAIIIQPGGGIPQNRITGTVFDDHNGNAVKNPNDEALQGWTVFLDANNNGVLDAGERSTTTNAQGQYTFANPAAGTYRIREVVRPGWRQTTPVITVTVPVGGVNSTGNNIGDQRVDLTIASTDSGGQPQVNVIFADPQRPQIQFRPYEAGFSGGVRIAAADVTGTGGVRDGQNDVITAPGAGRAAALRVFDTTNPAAGPVRERFPFGAGYTGGMFLATGDVTGDGFTDIIIGSGINMAPTVVVYDFRNDRFLSPTILPYETTFRGGVHVTAEDVNGDGRAEIIVAPGAGRRADVRVYNFNFNAATGRGSPTLLRTITALPANELFGAWVAADGNRLAVGTGGGVPEVRIFNLSTGAQSGVVRPFNNLLNPNGVRVAWLDVNDDGTNDLVAAAGQGNSPMVSYFDGRAGANFALLGQFSFFAFDESVTGGIFVAGSRRRN